MRLKVWGISSAVLILVMAVGLVWLYDDRAETKRRLHAQSREAIDYKLFVWCIEYSLQENVVKQYLPPPPEDGQPEAARPEQLFGEIADLIKQEAPSEQHGQSLAKIAADYGQCLQELLNNNVDPDQYIPPPDSPSAGPAEEGLSGNLKL